MGRKRKIDETLKALIAMDLREGKKRGYICETHGVSYRQIAVEFGATCTKPRKQMAETIEAEVV